MRFQPIRDIDGNARIGRTNIGYPVELAADLGPSIILFLCRELLEARPVALCAVGRFGHVGRSRAASDIDHW